MQRTENKLDLADTIYRERTKLYYSQLSTTRVGAIVTSLVVTLIFYSIVPNAILFSWLFVQITIVLVRIKVTQQYQTLEYSIEKLKFWIVKNKLLSLVSGISWGMSSILFYTDQSIIYPIILSLILFGTTSATINSDASFPSIHYFYSFPVISLLSYSLLSSEIAEFQLIAFLYIVFLVVSFSYSRNSYRAVLRSIDLSLENLQLVSQLQIQKDAAVKSSKEKSEFLAGASHDLRQPMHALGLFTDALYSQNVDAKLVGTIDNIKKTSRILVSMMNSILDTSKLNAGVMRPDVTEFSIQQIFDNIEQQMSEDARSKNIRLRIVANNSMVKSDPFMLERIIRNIIGNAIRYTVIGSVFVSCRKRSDQLCVQIKDSGEGIEENRLNDIFKPFYQVESKGDKKPSGSGLGLSIVKRLADLLDHKITVQSVVNKGTTFSIFLPLIKNTRSVNLVNPEKYVGDLIGQTLLVIDDDPLILEAMTSILKKWHCEIIVAENSQQAIEKLSGTGITLDLIISDFHLSNGDTGLDAINSIRNHLQRTNADLPAIVITGDISIDQLDLSDDIYVLHKPVSPNKLRSLLSYSLLQCDEKDY